MQGAHQVASGGGGGGAAAIASPASALLLSIPGAELHRVVRGQQRLEAQGPFCVYSVDAPQEQSQPSSDTKSLYPSIYQPGQAADAGPGSSIWASVGQSSWKVLPASQTLKVGQLTYVFTTEREYEFLSVTLAADTDSEGVGMLEAVLESVSLYRESLLASPEAQAGEAALAERAYKSSVAQGVQSVSKRLASGLLASATYASAAMNKKASSLASGQPTTAPVTISPGAKKRIQQTERAAALGAKAVNGAVSGLAWAGAKVAGGVLWLMGANKPVEQGEDPSALRETSQAAILGFAQVWDAMEDAGKEVMLSARDGTAAVVRHRYGEEAAEVSVSGMNAAGHSADAVYAARKLGVKTVAKAAAKKTAKGVLRQWARVDARPAGSGAAGGGGRVSAAPAGSVVPSNAR